MPVTGASCAHQLSAFAAISYPFGVAWALTLFQGGHYITQAKTAKPKLFVMGTKDNFTGLGNFESHVKSFPSPLDVVTVKVRGVRPRL